VSIPVIVTSCMKHAEHWDTIRNWGRALGNSEGFLIFSGAHLDTPYVLNRTNNTLLVNSSDAYDALPEKLLRTFHTVLDAPELAGTTHILKVDDTDVYEPPWVTLNPEVYTDPPGTKPFQSFSMYPYDMPVGVMEQQLRGVSADYMCPESGIVLNDCSTKPIPYAYVHEDNPKIPKAATGSTPSSSARTRSPTAMVAPAT